jgi:hypothetical protein
MQAYSTKGFEFSASLGLSGANCRMRERSLLVVFLVLNVALFGAFVTYLFLSNSRQPKVVATSFPTAGKTNLTTNSQRASVRKTAVPKTNTPTASSNKTSEVKTNSPLASASLAAKPVFANKKFTWQEVESDEYLIYLENLHAVGCPEEKVRQIILADIDELIAKKRLKEAIAHDTEWWRAEPQAILVNVLRERARALEVERRNLITKLVGPDGAEDETDESVFWSNVQLTGPVLGSLAPPVHNQVQEMCARSMERLQSARSARFNEGQPLNQVEEARLREQTRADLQKVLNSEQLEEFLLRYSHNAHNLRDELRAVEPTAEEFRRIFRATDPLDHQMQLDYGGLEALSDKQRERYQRQRDEAIREALSPERFHAYLLTKDPLYRQAQTMALQYGAPSKAVMPIYQMTKLNESKRQKIIHDTTLTSQQKSEALSAVAQEQQKSIQQIVTEASSSQR